MFRRPRENHSPILELLSLESGGIFRGYFKSSLKTLVEYQFSDQAGPSGIPRDFLVNHMASSLAETVLWRIKQTPEELDRYFRAVIEPVWRPGSREGVDEGNLPLTDAGT